MTAFKIAGFTQAPRDWETSNGKFRSYYLSVEDDPKTYELAQKRETPAPNIGDTIEGTVETREHNGVTYYKIKKERQGGGGFNGNRPRDPAERESIERQVAAKAGADLLVAMMGQGSYKPSSVGDLADAHGVLVKKIAATIAGRGT